MSIIMEQQSSAKQNFFNKSPEMTFLDSPGLSLFRGLSNKFLNNWEPINLAKQASNISIRKPSPWISSLAPSPFLESYALLGKSPAYFLQDSKPLPTIKLDFLPLGSPEINFVLGPSALEIQNQKLRITKSIFDKHTKCSPDEKIAIKHIQAGGPTIYVSNKRVNRILKRRKKRVEFLMNNPEFSLPYKFRTKGPRHQSRSISAKNRSRKDDGRFACATGPIDFSIDIDDIKFKSHLKEEDIIRDKI